MEREKDFPALIIAIPDEYLLKIGKISVAWGTLEALVDVSLSKLAGFSMGDPRCAIITAHMSWPAKVDALDALALSLSTEYPHLSKFSDVRPLLKAAQDGRNRTSHGQWGMEEGKVIKLRLTARGKLRTSMDEVSLKELDAILEIIGRAGRTLLSVILNKEKYLS